MSFDVCFSMKHPSDTSMVSVIDVIDDPKIDIPIDEIFVVETSVAVIKNIEGVMTNNTRRWLMN